MGVDALGGLAGRARRCRGTSRSLPLGGEGCPEVAEFAVIEFAAALGRSTESGRRYLSHAVEGHYRLPRCWARLEAGELPAWRLCFIADRTLCPVPGSGGVRGHPCRTGGAQDRPRPAGPADRGGQGPVRPRPDRGRPTAPPPSTATSTSPWPTTAVTGTVHVDAELDLADALDLEAAVAADAHQQLLARLHRVPRRPPLHRRRPPGPRPTRPRPPPRPDQPRRSAPTGGAARPPQPTRRSSAPAGWPGCGRSRVRSPPSRSGSGAPTPTPTSPCRPVLDLAEHIQVGSYEASARLKAQIDLRDLICAFPFCFRPAHRCDCDHRVPHDPDRDDGDRPAPATSRPPVGATTAPRPPAAGAMSPSNPGSTCGAARSATSSSATPPAPSTSPPTPNAAASPASSAPTSATQPTLTASTTRSPDHPAPHPAWLRVSGGVGMRTHGRR